MRSVWLQRRRMFAHVSSIAAQVKGTSLDVLLCGMAVLVLGDFFQDELMG